ncbi:hypothetical protein NT017_11310 [Prolixibacter sp. NT017]|nr:hypothetical protein NT017_11310 [Prolixibacter sp. NT017]
MYDPLEFHGTQLYTYPQLMGLYCATAGFADFSFVRLIRLFPYFSNEQEWTLIKEFTAVVFILLGVSIGIFVIQFFIDPQIPQWTFRNFLGSVKNAYLIGSLPFLFSMIINISNKIHHDSEISFSASGTSTPSPDAAEELIQIESKLKKETLEFYPSQFLYAESDGNYVVFYLQEKNEIKKKIIRNSISQIENQLTSQTRFFRTHRSFIVNLEKVTGKDGNTSGYRITVEGLSTEIPVSRQNVAKFDELYPFKG